MECVTPHPKINLDWSVDYTPKIIVELDLLECGLHSQETGVPHNFIMWVSTVFNRLIHLWNIPFLHSPCNNGYCSDPFNGDGQS